MKFLDKTALVVYSTIMLIVSVVICLIIFNWLDLQVVESLMDKALDIEWITNTLLAVSVVFILLSIKCIFFSSTDREESFKQGVLLQNENGKLMITEETLESLVTSVAQGFDSIQLLSTRISLDEGNNVIVSVNLTVNQNVVIKELSTNLQTKIKETIKKMADLDVKEVNIRIKNVASKTEG